MKPKRAVLYTRVSSGEQNTEAQERALRDYVRRRGWTIQKMYRDHGMSGANANRPALNEMLKDCRRGSVDVVVVWKFDRFARSLKALISCLELCRSLGIDFVSVTEAVDTSLPAGELVFQMIGAVAPVRAIVDWGEGEGGTGECQSEGQNARPTRAAEPGAQRNR